jgi:hypothetical protein
MLTPFLNYDKSDSMIDYNISVIQIISKECLENNMLIFF